MISKINEYTRIMIFANEINKILVFFFQLNNQ